MERLPRVHADCRNFAPVDVAKGVCHRTKDLTCADGEGCEHFAQTARCKFCRSFAPSVDAFLGTCTAVPSRPMAYPDLNAVTCRHYVARD